MKMKIIFYFFAGMICLIGCSSPNERQTNLTDYDLDSIVIADDCVDETFNKYDSVTHKWYGPDADRLNYYEDGPHPEQKGDRK